ncbi:MAG: NAD-dependent epimerase/dehydratase family protein [Candidatus Aenigmatarchaeota archaeon]
MILVTGGCGFIGTHLVNRLIELGNEVVVLDNISTGKKENLNKRAKLIVGDVRIPDDVGKAMKDCEACFHLAAITELRDANDDLVYQTNFLATKSIADIAEEFGVKLIYTSSAAVYGNGKIPNNEEGECKPLSQYGKSKLKSEKILKNAFVARLFNTYGKGGNSFVNKLCKKIPNYDEFNVYGNGLQTRDFIHVSDIVDALLLGVENSGIYNVGSGKETSVLQLMDIVKEIANAKPLAKFTMPHENEISRSRADITKIKGLGWEPKVSIVDGIRMTLEESGVKLDH